MPHQRLGIVPAVGPQRTGNRRGDAAADTAVRHHLHQHQGRKDERHTGKRFGAEETDEVRLHHADQRLHDQYNNRRQG
jgi:protein-disulfide isomerase-like protein with CxxC motif